MPRLLVPGIMLLVITAALAAQESTTDKSAALIREVNLKRHAERLSKLKEEEMKERLGLARTAVSRKLAEQARELIQSVLAEDPENTDARAELERIPADDVVPAADALKTFMAQRAAIMKKAAARRVLLAKWCASQALDLEARAAFDVALRLDPDNKDARDALGFARFNGVWHRKDDLSLLQQGLVPHGEALWVTSESKPALDRGMVRVGSIEMTVAEADARKGRWSEAWDLRSRHYHIISNLGFTEIEEILMRFERARSLIADLFGPELPMPPDLQEVRWTRTLEEVRALVPKLNLTKTRYNGLLDGVLYTSNDPAGSPAVRVPRLAFECIASFGATSAGIETIVVKPGFVFYLGLAESMAGIGFRDGRWGIDPAILQSHQQGSLKLHAEGPPTIERLIQATAEQSGMIYGEWWPAVITFTAFLFEGRDAETRRNLLKFLAAVIRGEGDADLFRKSFAPSVQTLHTEWGLWLKTLVCVR